MPKVLKDVAICRQCQCRSDPSMVQSSQLTLLFELKQNTISECTFLLFILPSTRSLTARNAAARTCVLELIYSCFSRRYTTIHHHHRHPHSTRAPVLSRDIESQRTRKKLTTAASMKAYSKSELPAKSCWCRKEALAREVKRVAWRV